MSETALLRAVRDELRSSPVNYREDQCEIELDAMELPACVGDLYVAVLAAGYQAGPHNSAGGTSDLIYSIDVAVIKRSPRVPRDRKRELLFSQINSLNAEIKKISTQVDFTYRVNNAANNIIRTEEESGEGFIEPLALASVDSRPMPVPAEWFAAKPGEPQAGLMRTIHFTGARRITTRT